MWQIRSFVLSGRKQLSASIKTGGAFIAASMIANVVNFLYSAYLGRISGFEEFGLISLIASFLNLSQIPLQAYSSTISHRTSYLFGKYGTPAKPFWAHFRGGALKPALLLSGAWLVLIPFMAAFFQTDRLLPFLLFTPIWSVGVAAAVDSGFLSGSMRFNTLAAMMLSEVSVKFAVTVLMVLIGLPQYVYVAIPAGIITSYVIGWLVARGIVTKHIAHADFHSTVLPRRFYASSFLSKVSLVAFLTMDAMLAKHYLPPKEAGQYALLSLVGKMVFFMGTLFTQFLTPLISKHEGAGRNSTKIFWVILLLTTAAVLGGVTTVGVFGYITIPFLLGPKAWDIVAYLPTYTFAMGCMAIAMGFVSYHQSRRVHLFAVASFGMSLIMLTGIVLWHGSVEEIAKVLTVSGIIFLMVTMFLHRFHEAVSTVIRNIRDFLELFLDDKQKREGMPNSLRILIFNWRDTQHVWAGGAEEYIHQLSKRWVKDGHSVTVFCGNDQKHARNEVIDGVQMVRRGGFYMVYLWAALYYIFRFRGQFDVIVDAENGIPFFTPLFVRKPTILLIHHVHQDVFRDQLWLPLAMLATFLETKLMPMLYRNVPVVTVSESSKKEILRVGFGVANTVTIVYPGIEPELYKTVRKTAHPSVLYLGRLRPYKQVDVLIRAFAKALSAHPEMKLTIAGEGVSLKELETLANSLNISHAVQFTGRVSEREKVALLGSHWVMVQPSSIEGWGITVIEANACGTPVIASDVHGLRDSVVDEKTGLLVHPGDHQSLAAAVSYVITHHEDRKQMTAAALDWSKSFDWDQSAAVFLQVLKRSITGHRKTISGRPITTIAR